MRNLSQYPITEAEKIAVLRRMIDQEKSSGEVGGITVVALEMILRDLYRISAFHEGIDHD